MGRYAKKIDEKDEEQVVDFKIRTRSMSQRKKLKITKPKTTPFNVYELRNRRCRRINLISSSAKYKTKTTTFNDAMNRTSSSCSSGVTASFSPSNSSQIVENYEEIAVKPAVEIASSKIIDCNKLNSEIDTANELEREGMDGLNSQTTTTENSTVRIKPMMMMPSKSEIEDFFSSAEKDLQKRFSDKYNFDVVKDVPLEGRYEWVQIGK